jgi:hypothetical protein
MEELAASARHPYLAQLLACAQTVVALPVLTFTAVSARMAGSQQWEEPLARVVVVHTLARLYAQAAAKLTVVIAVSIRRQPSTATTSSAWRLLLAQVNSRTGRLARHMYWAQLLEQKRAASQSCTSAQWSQSMQIGRLKV